MTKPRRSNAHSLASAAPRRSARQPTAAREIAALKQRVDALLEREETFEAALNEWVSKVQEMRIATEALIANASVLLRAARPYPQRKQTD